MPRSDRIAEIGKIESLRQSRVITYICSDRENAAGRIGDDAVRVMYDLLRVIGRVPKIDLFIYSRGGALEVPWRIVCMLREHFKELGVIIPYRANSAATLISLGCDEIVMSTKAELGAIDPALPRISREGGTLHQEEVRVEDVMSYVSFLREKAKIEDDKTIGIHTHALAEKLGPWTLGQIYRTHSHIRTVAQRMLDSHRTPLEPEKAQAIVNALAEETKSHGHAISRSEAEKLGLRIIRPSEELEGAIWALFESYEIASQMRDPLDPLTILGARDEADIRIVIAWLESTEMTWAFRGDMKIKAARNAPQAYEIKVALAFNLNFTPPPGVDLQNLPPPVVQQLRHDMMQQLQQQVPTQLQGVPNQVRESVRLQSPLKDVQARLVGKWANVTSEGI